MTVSARDTRELRVWNSGCVCVGLRRKYRLSVCRSSSVGSRYVLRVSAYVFVFVFLYGKCRLLICSTRLDGSRSCLDCMSTLAIEIVDTAQ